MKGELFKTINTEDNPTLTRQRQSNDVAGLAFCPQHLLCLMVPQEFEATIQRSAPKLIYKPYKSIINPNMNIMKSQGVQGTCVCVVGIIKVRHVKVRRKMTKATPIKYLTKRNKKCLGNG